MQQLFTLRYHLGGQLVTNTLIERLGAKGCDDALIGSGRRGWLVLKFAREAANAQAAMASAMQDVRQVLPQAQLIEAVRESCEEAQTAHPAQLSGSWLVRKRS